MCAGSWLRRCPCGESPVWHAGAMAVVVVGELMMLMTSLPAVMLVRMRMTMWVLLC